MGECLVSSLVDGRTEGGLDWKSLARQRIGGDKLDTAGIMTTLPACALLMTSALMVPVCSSRQSKRMKRSVDFQNKSMWRHV